MPNSNSSPMIVGKKYADREANRINQKTELVEKILVLYRQHTTCREIYNILKSDLELYDGAKEKTNGGVIERIVRMHIHASEREIIQKEIHRRALLLFDDKLQGGKRKGLQERGLVDWLPEETAILMEIRQLPEMAKTKTGRCDNERVAAKLNEIYMTDIFSGTNCRVKASNETFRSKSRKETQKTSNDTSASALSEFPASVHPVLQVHPRGFQLS